MPFKRSGRHFRVKSTAHVDDSSESWNYDVIPPKEDGEEPTIVRSSGLTKRQRGGKAQPVPASRPVASRLSFADEEEEEPTFQVKKSSRSRRLRRFGVASLEPPSSMASTAPSMYVLPLQEYNSHCRQPLSLQDVYGKETAREKAVASEDISMMDEESVRIAKRQRELARRKGVTRLEMERERMETLERQADEADGIPTIDVVGSRLLKEDEADGPEPDAFGDQKGETLFFGDPTRLEKERKRYEMRQAEQLDAQGSNDDAWEMEMIRKGGGVSQRKGGPLRGGRALSGWNITPSSMEPSHDPIIEMKPPSGPSPEELLSKMQMAEREANEALKEVQSRREQAHATLEDASTILKELEGDKSTADQQYRYFQELRLWLNDLIDCVDAKSSVIVALEQEVEDMMSNRAQALQSRRKHYADDGWYDVDVALGTRVEPPSISRVDEFGRDVRSAEQVARERRKKEWALRRRVNEEVQGWLTEEEEEEVAVHRNQALVVVLERTNGLWDDARGEFAHPRGLLAKVVEWRSRYPKSFRDSFAALSIPELLSPYAAGELLSWNPADGAVFFGMAWFDTFLSLEGVSDEVNGFHVLQEAGEEEIIPGTIERVVLPRATRWMEHVWDPWSIKSTTAAVGLVDSVLDFVGMDKMQEIMGVVTQRLVHSVEHSRLTWCPAYKGFCVYQMWSLIKLLHCIMLWHGRMDVAQLKAIGIQQLLESTLRPFLQHLSQEEREKARSKIIAGIPQNLL